MMRGASRIAGLRTMVAVAVLAASAGQVDAQQRVRRILNGVPTAEFESVGIVGSRVRGAFCTGTLITPRHVLTAAHCATEAVSPTDGTFEVGEQIYTTSAIHIHPDYDPDVPANDIAIYELSESVVGVEPSPIFIPPDDEESPLKIGATLYIVGFGGGGDAQSGDDGTFGTKRVGTTPVDGLNNTDVIWFFDNEDESNTGFGDSGGPGFLLIDGEFFVASITSSGTDPNAALGDVAFNTRVDAFAVWIAETVEDTTTPSPPDEMPPPPDDEEIPPADDEPIPPAADEFIPPAADRPDGMYCPAGQRPDARPGGHGGHSGYGLWGRPGNRHPVGLRPLGRRPGRFQAKPLHHGSPGHPRASLRGNRRP